MDIIKDMYKSRPMLAKKKEIPQTNNNGLTLQTWLLKIGRVQELIIFKRPKTNNFIHRLNN